MKLELDELEVTNKISQMILNGKIEGVLDQAKGIVILGKQSEYTNNQIYEHGLDIIQELIITANLIESKTKYAK